MCLFKHKRGGLGRGVFLRQCDRLAYPLLVRRLSPRQVKVIL